ncbi:transaldolase family protein [Acaryochloris sp. IP29b_bin.137]|uniref:transaldolase family protein n=1 Tax=Acaryochloris sp. IP29b_bin.137 TaxID=2969217 RepID=UPI0026063DA9|nr:transaldolase family protein [Acaryochloris sp. IP29b_bin.137]
MYLFLDTADLAAWDYWLSKGLFYGVTTNPTLLERATIPCTLEQLKILTTKAFDQGVQEIHLQTWGTQVEDLVCRGCEIADIDSRVVVKVPITLTGTEAAAQLIQQGIRVTLTGVYAVHQALIAAALTADYAAPYLGRMTDLGQDGRQDIIAMQQGLNGVNSDTKLLVASIRSIDDITTLTKANLDTFTVSPAIAEQMFQVEATNKAAEVFENAAQG